MLEKGKVNVLVKTEKGTWEYVFKNIDEKIATEIWLAGFKTGQNNISIENEISLRLKERR